jgi:hypothetical protein
MSGTSYLLVNIDNFDFDKDKWFANCLEFAIYFIEMSLLSTKAFHLGLDLLSWCAGPKRNGGALVL